MPDGISSKDRTPKGLRTPRPATICRIPSPSSSRAPRNSATSNACSVARRVVVSSPWSVPAVSAKHGSPSPPPPPRSGSSPVASILSISPRSNRRPGSNSRWQISCGCASTTPSISARCSSRGCEKDARYSSSTTASTCANRSSRYSRACSAVSRAYKSSRPAVSHWGWRGNRCGRYRPSRPPPPQPTRPRPPARNSPRSPRAKRCSSSSSAPISSRPASP